MLHMVVYNVHATLSILPTLPITHCIHKSTVRLCPYSCLQIGSSGPFFKILHICMYIPYLVFSFWLIHSVWQTKALQNCPPSVRDIHVQKCRSIQGFSHSLCKMKLQLIHQMGTSSSARYYNPTECQQSISTLHYFFLLPKIPWTEEPGRW